VVFKSVFCVHVTFHVFCFAKFASYVQTTVGVRQREAALMCSYYNFTECLIMCKFYDDDDNDDNTIKSSISSSHYLYTFVAVELFVQCNVGEMCMSRI